MKAIVLLSGGLDSTTCLAKACAEQYQTYALSFNYSQRHIVELEAAKMIAKKYNVLEHYIVDIRLPNTNTSSLTNKNINVPEYTSQANIPNTYVPGRNTLFLSYAISLAEAIQADSIWIGCSSIDYSGYPDCRPEYIKAFQHLVDLAIPAGINNKPLTIRTPLINLSKAETIALGLELGVDYSETISCYRATVDNTACGECDSCVLREKGFAELNQQ
jgi:7-cyano-7-deazaguanine synthase